MDACIETPATALRHPVFGLMPQGFDFLLSRQEIRMLDFWHRKSTALMDANLPKGNEGDLSPAFNDAHATQWRIFEAAIVTPLKSASEFAVMMALVARHTMLNGDASDGSSEGTDLGDYVSAKRFAEMAERLGQLTAPKVATKQIGRLTRGRKLTRAGLLYRYQAFLVQELETLSWNLYGERDFAKQFRAEDRAVNARCSGRAGKRRSQPFFNEHKLTDRARSVLKSLRINITTDEDASPTSRKGGSR